MRKMQKPLNGLQLIDILARMAGLMLMAGVLFAMVQIISQI